MSKKGTEISRAEKRKIEKMNTRKRNQNMMIIAVVFIIIIGAVFYLISMNNPDGTPTESGPVSDDYIQTETLIEIPVSSISTESTFYTYESDGIDIKYFAVIGNDDQIHVATDACDVCYHAKEGYRQTGDEMECINCGLTFPIEDIGEKNSGGGCWPSFIPFTIEDENIIINKTDLESKRFMFE